MVSRLIIAMALAASLTGCVEYTVYLPGTESEAISICAPNGGVKRIEISTGGDVNSGYKTWARIECKNNSIVAHVTADSRDAGTVAQFKAVGD